MKDISTLLQEALGAHLVTSKPVLYGKISSLYLEDGVVLRDYDVCLSNGEKCSITVASPAVQKFPFPVIAAHQTNRSGRKEALGRAEDTSLSYGLMLARRGHKVYGIDLRWTGDRQPNTQWDLSGFRDQYPAWSPLGADCQDFKDLIYLMRYSFGEQLPFNWFGHSHGAINGYILAATEPAGTFGAVVCNAGFVGFPNSTSVSMAPNLERYFNASFSKEAWLSLGAVMAIACDKTSLRLNCYEDDGILPYPLPNKTQIAAFLALGNRLELAVYSGKHAFPQEAQINSALFLERLSPSSKVSLTPYLPWLSAQHNVAGIDEKKQPNEKNHLHFNSFGCIGINTTEHGCTILSALIDSGLPPKFVLVSAETDEQLECSAPYFDREDWLLAGTYRKIQDVTRQNTLASLACAAEIPTLFVPGLSSHVAVNLAKFAQVDVIFLAETPVLRGDILKSATVGLINFHAAPLPCYRGSNATLWALYHDEPLEVWAHFVDAGVDTGDLICCLPLPVYRSDDINALATRACQVSAALAVQLIRMARADGVGVIQQDARRAQRFSGPMPSEVLEACQTRLTHEQYSFYAKI